MKCIRPLAVDAVVLSEDHFLLVRRMNEPYRGMLALPGGFVEADETVEEAVMREVKEETGLDTAILSLVGIYSKPGRDPRGPVVSVCYAVKVRGGSLQASSDASHLELHQKDKVPPLAFDHNGMIGDALERLPMNHTL